MNRFVLAVLFLCLTPAVAQQPAPKTSQRYQIVATTVTDTASSDPDKLVHIVFLLDTQTGQVWRYFTKVGGLHDLKPQDQYSDQSGVGTTVAVSPGSFVPVQKIESSSKPK